MPGFVATRACLVAFLAFLAVVAVVAVVAVAAVAALETLSDICRDTSVPEEASKELWTGSTGLVRVRTQTCQIFQTARLLPSAS